MVDLARAYEASGVVVGLPKNMNGTEGPQAEKTREFAAAIAAEGLAVSLWDERLSTVEATRRMAERGRRRRDIQLHVDAEAAALILQTYLDHLRLKAKNAGMVTDSMQTGPSGPQSGPASGSYRGEA
jgi:putative Holliday junction resolvase